MRRAPWQPLVLLIAAGIVAVALSRQQANVLPALGAFHACAWGGVNCVVDGDTIRYRGERIRIMDIDAPEVFSPGCASELALGRRAAERLLAWINEAPFEIVVGDARDIDRYGRKLRLIRRNGQSVGSVLIAEGLARPWEGRRRSWCEG